jgi:phytanoyl-CoA hydroxylase
MCCHFADSACHYIDIKGTFQQDIADEILSYATKKYARPGLSYTYYDIWRRKSRLVTGK